MLLSALFANSAPAREPAASVSPPAEARDPRQESQQEAGAPTPQSAGLRQFRQLGLFFAGAGLFAASIAVSRRAVLRRQRESFPRFYVSNRNPAQVDSADRSLLAAEALGLATLNVVSFGFFLTGGLSWAFDLSSLVELRQRTRAALSRPGLVNSEDEKELEAMMDSLMTRLGMDKLIKQDEEQKDQDRKPNEK